jgi:hypothetical protein
MKDRLSIFLFLSSDLRNLKKGEMAERFKAVDSKSIVPFFGTGGSNPSLSAMKKNFLKHLL